VGSVRFFFGASARFGITPLAVLAGLLVCGTQLLSCLFCAHPWILTPPYRRRSLLNLYLIFVRPDSHFVFCCFAHSLFLQRDPGPVYPYRPPFGSFTFIFGGPVCLPTPPSFSPLYALSGGFWGVVVFCRFCFVFVVVWGGLGFCGSFWGFFLFGCFFPSP